MEEADMCLDLCRQINGFIIGPFYKIKGLFEG